ncbi:MAG: hypothetical protein RM338_30215 [Nostoc sp. DedQUE12a]|nr:hypothetical protein [Nostoc sp. DedQUE12a]
MNKLYELIHLDKQDFYLWIETTAKQLKEGHRIFLKIKRSQNQCIV